MNDLVVIVPTRGRPDRVGELADLIYYTEGDRSQYDVRALFVVDETDPALPEYLKVLRPGEVLVTPSRSMVQALNLAAWHVVSAENPPFAVAFLGDDHLPRTLGWHKQYLEALRDLGTGLVYGNDLIQGERIPTQVAMTADIVHALGYMAPTVLTHLYVDNYWKSLGVSADCLRYLPDVVVEHRHPSVGKADWDAGYARVNESRMYARDEAAFRQYDLDGRFAADVLKVRTLRGAA